MPSAFDLYTFYLQPQDLRGHSITVTVAAATVDEVFNPRIKRNEKRLVVAFAGKKKVLPLNKSQAAALVDAAKTDDYTRWPGVSILLTPGQATNGKDTIIITPAPASAGNGEISEPPEESANS